MCFVLFVLEIEKNAFLASPLTAVDMMCAEVIVDRPAKFRASGSSFISFLLFFQNKNQPQKISTNNTFPPEFSSSSFVTFSKEIHRKHTESSEYSPTKRKNTTACGEFSRKLFSRKAIYWAATDNRLVGVARMQMLHVLKRTGASSARPCPPLYDGRDLVEAPPHVS